MVALKVKAAHVPEAQPDVFEVWPENQSSVETFLRMVTQWRATMSGVVGLDYNVLFQIMDLYAINDQVMVFEDVRIMESAALAILNKAGSS